MTKHTDAPKFVEDLGAGAFAQQLGIAISAVAEGAIKHGKDGEVTIKLKMKRIGDSSQVNVSHTLAFKEPTSKGSRSEDTTSETPMYFNSSGNVTLFAEHTNQLFGLKVQDQEA